MQKTKLIQEIIGKSIEPYGFNFIGKDQKSWLYQKQISELKQDIIIYLMAEGKLKIYFSTNAYGQKPIYGETLVGEGEDRGDFLGFYKYDNEQEFIEVIKYFRKIIFDYGFRALDNISLPTTEIRPTKETNLYLYENHKELNEKYREKFGINENTSHEEIFKIAQECLIKTQGEVFDTVKDTLIGLAAVVGTFYVDISNGGWLWDPDKHICWVTNKAKYPKMDYPLSTIIVCWRENPEHTFTILNNGFQYFKI